MAIHHDNNFLGGDLASLGRPHGIGSENNKQTKLTVEPSPKTKELRATHRGPVKLEVLIGYKTTVFFTYVALFCNTR